MGKLTPEEIGRAKSDGHKDAAAGCYKGPTDNSSLYSNIAERSDVREERRRVYDEAFRERKEYNRHSK